MRRQRGVALARHRRESSRFYKGAEGPWTEKLITFTVPHGDSVAADAECIRNTWPRVLRLIRKHLGKRGAVRRTPGGKLAPISVPWCRALEVAGAEHVHLHVWWYGPFLDVVLLRKWWGELLIEAGRAVPARQWGEVAGKGHGKDRRLAGWMGNPAKDQWVPWPVVDIRSEKGSGLGAYTQKVGLALYVQKGTDLQFMEPAHVAALYEVFEGTRAVQWARGWAPPKLRRHSGARFRRLTEEEKKQFQNAESRAPTPTAMRQIATSGQKQKIPQVEEKPVRKRMTQLAFDKLHT